MDILKIKGWVIFLAFLFIFGPIVILLDYVGTHFSDSVTTILGTIFLLTLYFLYPLLVGLKLRSLLSSQTNYNAKTDISLILDLLIVLVTSLLAKVLNLEELVPNVIVAVIGIVGVVRLGSFPANQIRSIELKRNAGMWEYVSETFQMVYWPLGVLWMQPRINKIATGTVKIDE